MATLTPIQGLYYSIGSKDLPVGYNHNDKYGFEGTNPSPIFKYSPVNVDNFFFKPVKCMRLKVDEVQTLIVESSPATGLEGISHDDFVNNGFEALFEALNILYDRADVTDPDIVYTSKGDRLLSEASLYNRYKANSLYMELDTIDTELRIVYVKFKFKLFDNVEYTNILVYFSPDLMFENKGFDDGRYNITYTTKGVENSESGLESIITNGSNSLLDLENLRNYTNVCKFSTQFNVLSPDRLVIDSYSRTFFIHNVMYKGYELTDFKKILLIKKYLNYEYASYGDEKRIILNKEYPELFTANSVDIFPLVTPNINDRYSSVITNQQIRHEIERRGITIDLSDDESAKRIEIIMLEGIGPFDSNDYSNLSMANRNFITPIMVVSNDPSLYIGVIYDSFKEFSPIFTGYENKGESWEQFHFYLKMFIKLVTGIIPWKYSGYNDEQLTTILNLLPSMQLYTERVSIYGTEFINSISFDFLEITYTVHNFYRYEAII